MKHEGNRAGRRVVRMVLAASVAIVLGACARDPRLQGLLNMEAPSETEPTRDRREELKQLIAEYEAVVNEKVDAGLKEARYLKFLAQEYMRYELYGPALETLEQSLKIEPRNPVVHELAGVCAGYIAKAQARPEERSAYFALAEQYYRQSVEIDPSYRDGLYALGVLYHFELDRQLDAIDVLNRIIERSPSDMQALFVLARAYAALGNVDEAVRTYDRIIENAADKEMARQARRNRLLLLGDAP